MRFRENAIGVREHVIISHECLQYGGYNAAILVCRVAMFVMPCTDVNRLPSSLMSLSLDANKELLQKGDCRLLPFAKRNVSEKTEYKNTRYEARI